MKTKFLLLALFLLPSIAMAQETRSQAAQSLTQLGMSPELSEKVAGLATGLGVISNNVALKWRNAAGSANVNVLNMDGSDAVQILGGAGASSNITTRLGNTSAKIRFVNQGGNEVWSINNDGRLDNTSGGNVNLTAPGTTIAIEESSAAAACMGEATPNGTTPVAVSTTCAGTGSRVFFSRQGAVTNMGTITTTTEPAGTGFSFASTGASDTLAGSVFWFIIGEAP